MKKIITLITILNLCFIKIMGQEGNIIVEGVTKVEENKEQSIEEQEGRVLEKTFTVLLEERVNVFVPLEIISDVNIEATLIGDQSVEIPFEVELNREPEKRDYYSIKYSESVIDIDKDGEIDTYIYSPSYINDRVSKDNFIKIYGDKITTDGKHKKNVYMEVEVGN